MPDAVTNTTEGYLVIAIGAISMALVFVVFYVIKMHKKHIEAKDYAMKVILTSNKDMMESQNNMAHAVNTLNTSIESMTKSNDRVAELLNDVHKDILRGMQK